MAESERKIAELNKCLEMNTKKQARKYSHEIDLFTDTAAILN